MSTVCTKEDWSFYNNGFQELLARTSPPRAKRVAEYFGRHQQRFGFDRMEHLLSVGPNEGVVDMHILEHFPKCEQYTAIEPNPLALPSLEDKLKKSYPNIQYQLVNKTVEVWEGPCSQVDLVIAAFVLQHLEDKQKSIQTMLSWLKPAGKLVIICSDNIDVCVGLRGMLLKDPQVNSLNYTYTDVMKDLEALETVKVVHEEKFTSQINFSNPTKELANFLLERICNNDEFEKICKHFEKVAPSGISEITAMAVTLETKTL